MGVLAVPAPFRGHHEKVALTANVVVQESIFRISASFALSRTRFLIAEGFQQFPLARLSGLVK
jgi:hypothetical protein